MGLAVLALAAAGCTEANPNLVGGDAVLADVAHNQAFAAVLVNPTRLSNGVRTGTLEVVPVTGGGAATVLDGRAGAAQFRHGSNLWFLGGVTVVNEGTPATPHLYGALYLWSFPMTKPVKIGENVREFYPSRDGSSCVFIDWAQKSIDPANTGTLKAVNAASCAAGTCVDGMPVTLASNLVAGQSSWALSNDGRELLVTVAGSDAAAPGQAILLALQGGQAQVLSTTPGVRSAMISPAGDTAAWVEGDNKLLAVSTADATPAPRAIGGVSAARIETAHMIDATNYVLVARAGAGDAPALMKLAPSGTTPLGVSKPVDVFVSQAVPGVTTSYVFYALAQSGGTENLYILDLSKSTAQPAQLGEAVAVPLATSLELSDDGAWVKYLDQYDVASGLGDAFVSPVATPGRRPVANDIRHIAFVPHTTHLLYVSGPSASNDAGVLTFLPTLEATPVVAGVGVINFVAPRSAPFRTYFTQQTNAPDDGVWYMDEP